MKSLIDFSVMLWVQVTVVDRSPATNFSCIAIISNQSRPNRRQRSTSKRKPCNSTRSRRNQHFQSNRKASNSTKTSKTESNRKPSGLTKTSKNMIFKPSQKVGKRETQRSKVVQYHGTLHTGPSVNQLLTTNICTRRLKQMNTCICRSAPTRSTILGPSRVPTRGNKIWHYRCPGQGLTLAHVHFSRYGRCLTTHLQ